MAVRRTSLARWVLGLGLTALALLLIAGAVLWTRRDRIARTLIAEELARRGVPARFRIVAIGPRAERIADIVIGDPAHPDLTAREATVRVRVGLAGVGVSAIEASGVRLRAEIAGGRLHLGSLDRLLPGGGSGGPPQLPPIRLTLHDARLALRTPAGALGLAVEGSGPLDDGFAGRVAVVAPALRAGGCDLADVSAVLHLVSEAGAPLVDGPVQASAIHCSGTTVVAPAAQLDVRMTAALDGWHGGARMTAARLIGAGARAEEATAEIGFSGDRARTLAGIDAGTGPLAFGGGQAASSALSGRFVVAADGLRGEADVSVTAASADPAFGGSLTRSAEATRDTPVGPIMASLSRAAVAALHRFDLAGRLSIAPDGAHEDLALSRGALRSASGFVATMQPRSRLTYGAEGLNFEGSAQASGGGLPSLDVRRNPDGAWLVRTGPMVAGNARLVLTPVRLASRAGGVQASGTATLDGPLPNGRVTGLMVPLRLAYAHGLLEVGPGCMPLRWGQLSVGTLSLGRSEVRLCPARGEALARVSGGGSHVALTLAPTRLRGTLGGQPLALDVGGGAFAGSPQGLRLTDVHAALGQGSGRSTLEIAALDAQLGGGGAGGRFAGGVAELGAVPFRISEAGGIWRFAGGALTLDDVAGRLTDRAAPARIRPLALASGTLRLRDGLVTADTTLNAPRGDRLATVTIRHDLSAGAGEARLAVRGLAFGPHLQPEQVTPLTVGVIADVAGTIDGDAIVRWSAAGVTSSGTFGTSHLNLAAAFGPVQGASGTIRFDDLLAVHTPPGQTVHIQSINPGIEVTDGAITYQLLGPERLVIESGHWPLAGGTLSLRPTTLDLTTGATRRFTLDVAGLDAARFIQQMQLDNLAVTGTFDGVLPLVFDANGGRIVGGRLVARAGGGTLSYVGEVSNAQLGTFGKLAFDALKSLRYHSLALDLDGALDGEVVSRVAVDGVNQQPVGATNLGKGFTGLPFRFNVTVRAPFRGLLNSARSFSNPGLLLHADPQAPVQPAASAPQPSQHPR